MVAATALLVVFSIAGLLLNPFSARVRQNEINRFKEPLIEQAVRLTLEKTDDENLSDQDLDSISAFMFLAIRRLATPKPSNNTLMTSPIITGTSIKAGSQP